jgi:phosphopantothenoylcysteine decarboxylase / phosphopantothenate---cysteine ligase
MTKTFSNKDIVLGITGSIAAYKACEVASRLVEQGAKVTPVLTKSAAQLVGPASLEAITGHRAILALFEPLQNPEIEHIAVATRADLFLIAPATANILAKAAHGIADDWLSTTLLATRAPILFAPAMNSNMYTHPATQANIELLKARGCCFVGPDAGRLACGAVGVGRMIDAAAILDAAVPLLSTRKELAGKHVLMTTGGTREAIDPVRFISNRSSGKMGREVALEAVARGAQVTAVAAPAETPLPYGVEVVPVETALEMEQAVMERIGQADVFIAVAAVGDFRAAKPTAGKQKRTGARRTLDLVENPDILARAGAARGNGVIAAGFAAETESLVENAAAKLDKKNLDLIVANQVGVPDSGFGADTTRAALLVRGAPARELPLQSKADLAAALFDAIVSLLKA